MRDYEAAEKYAGFHHLTIKIGNQADKVKMPPPSSLMKSVQQIYDVGYKTK